MRNRPDSIRQVAPVHARYWAGRDLPDYAGGPFADRTGGLITFSAPSMEDAERITRDDPFVAENLLEQTWLKEWLVE